MAAAAAAALGPDATLRATKVFRSHDVDGSGSIDLEEMRTALRELGLDAGQVRSPSNLALISLLP